MNGYIKIDRKITEWEWYKNEHTKNVFLHCLLSANWKDGKYMGKDIPRGSFVTSVKNISIELDLTEDEVKTALKHLIKTGELTKQTTNKFTVITVSNYDTYQDDAKQLPNNYQTITNQKQINYQSKTNQMQNNSIPITKQLPTIEERKEEKKERMEEGKKEKSLVVSNDTTHQTENVRRIIEKWNELSLYGIKEVSRVSPSSDRYKRLTARIKEYGEDSIIAAIECIKTSDFLRGKNNRGWVITFDWFVRPDNFPKVLEGNYDNREKTVNYQSKTSDMLQQHYTMAEEWAREMEGEKNDI